VFRLGSKKKGKGKKKKKNAMPQPAVVPKGKKR